MRLKEKDIYFNEIRHFSAMFSTTLYYVRQNFGAVGKLLLFVAGPVMIVAIMGASWYTNEFGMFELGYAHNNNFTEGFMNFIFYYLVIFSMLYVGRLWMMAVIAAHMIKTQEKGAGKFETTAIYEVLRKNLWRIIGVVFIVLFVIWLLVVPLTLLMHVAADSFEGVGFLVGFVYVCLIMIFYFTMSYINASIFFVMFKEDFGAWKSFIHAFKVIKGNFWNTWLIMFIATGALGLVWALLLTPPYVADMVYNLVVAEEIAAYEQNPWPILIVALMARLCFNLFWGFYYMLCGFNYYTSVERQTGEGLKKRIEEIGSGVTYRDVEPGY
jgi:hypothetical protein